MPIWPIIYTYRHFRVEPALDLIGGGNPALLFNMPFEFVLAVQGIIKCWIPAFAGMTSSVNYKVFWYTFRMQDG
jgi:hypothetical protein